MLIAGVTKVRPHGFLSTKIYDDIDILLILLDTNANYNALTYILSIIKMTCYILYMICCLQHFLSVFSLSPSYHIFFSRMMDIIVLLISLVHLCQRSYQ